MDPAMRNALQPPIKPRATDIGGRSDGFSARMDAMFERFPRVMVTRFGLMRWTPTAALRRQCRHRAHDPLYATRLTP
jgi:hypothetical protein